MVLGRTFPQLKKDHTDSREEIPLEAPKTFDWSFRKSRRWWESINKYFTIHQ